MLQKFPNVRKHSNKQVSNFICCTKSFKSCKFSCFKMFHMNFNIFCKCVSVWIFFQILHISNYFKAFQCLENKLEILQCLKGFKNFEQAMFQMWKTLKFWHVSFIMFGRAMFQNILCLSNVKNFEFLVCWLQKVQPSHVSKHLVCFKCDFFWNSHVWNECKSCKILRKQDWNFISCERLVLCNFQFVFKLFWYDQRNIEKFRSWFEGVNVVGWRLIALHWKCLEKT